MSEYLWGLATPFILVLSLVVAYFLLVLAVRMWSKCISYFVAKVVFSDEYHKRGNITWDRKRFTEYLYDSPRKYVMTVPGWKILFIREWEGGE